MSIADQITRIKNNIAASYAECSAKGATLPATENSENLPNTIASISSGTIINNQNKTFTENGTYTADAGYTGLGTVTVNVSGGGAGGDSITYTNITGATIAKDDKLWINTTATTTERQEYTLPATGSYVQTSNPNVMVNTSTLFTLQNGAYVTSSLAKVITMSNVGIDKNGLLFSSNALYDIENNMFYNGSFTSYIGNGYVYYYNEIYRIDVDNIGNILNTYSILSNKISNGWCFEDGIIIGFNPNVNQLLFALKLNNSSNTFEELYHKSFIRFTPIGQFTEQKIGWGLKGNAYINLNLGAYRYSRNGDDVNVEEIPATEFPEDMRPMFTEQPSCVFWNEQTLTLTASWQSTSQPKALIFKYINGEWVNKTPIISQFPNNLGYVTCDSSVSKIVTSSLQTRQPIIYDGNEKSGGYYGVPYLYSNKNTITAKADAECANNAESTASTVLFGGVVTPPSPEPGTNVDASKLKFGDRIDNKATVVGTFNSVDLGTVVYAVLDAPYIGVDIKCASDFDIGSTSAGSDFDDLPYYAVSKALNVKESATYNTNAVVIMNNKRKIEAYKFVRNIQPLNFNGTSYKCQLPNACELQQIFNKRTELAVLDPNPESASPKVNLLTWQFGTMKGAWSSNACAVGKSLVLGDDGTWFDDDRKLIHGVIPIIEIPVPEQTGGGTGGSTGGSGSEEVISKEYNIITNADNATILVEESK